MSIRSLIVKIGADTQAIDKALADVGSSSKNLADGLKKLGDTPIGKEAQASAEQLKKNLDAVNASIQRTADLGVNAAKGIDAIGGPAKLTTAQLNVMNKSVQDSIDAFRALGQQAPQELQKVAAAIQAQQKALQTPLVPQSSNPLAGALNSLPGGGILGQISTGGAIAAVAATATAGAAALTFATKAALDYADGLVKMSDKTGIGVEALQRLEAIAVPSGNSLDDLTRAVNQFQNRLIDGKADDALRKLGISFQQIRNAAPDEQFIIIAQALQKVADPAEQTRLAIELFGKAGAEILPSLKANVDQLKDSMVTMSADSVKALDDFGDDLARLKGNAVRLLGEIAASAISTTKSIIGVVDALAHAAVPPPPPRTDQDLRERPQLASSRVGASRSNADLGRVPDVLGSTPLQLPGALTGGAVQALKAFPEVVSQASSALKLLHADLLAQESAADAAGLSLEDYQKKIGEIDQKIDQANRPLTQFTQAQQDLIHQFRIAGLSADEIALKLGVSVKSVEAFHESLNSIDPTLQAFGRAMLDAGKSDDEIRQSLGLTAEQLTALKQKRADDVRLIQLEAGSNESLSAALEKVGQRDVETIANLKLELDFRQKLIDVERGQTASLGVLDSIGQKDVETIGLLKERFDKMKQASKELDDALSAIAGDFTQLSQIGGSSFNAITKGIAGALSGIKTFKDSLSALNSATTFSGLLTGIAGIAGAFIQVTSQIGQAITQELQALERSRIVHDVGRDMGVTISDGIAEGIRQSEVQLSNAMRATLENAGVPPHKALAGTGSTGLRVEATALNLPQIIQDAGGISGFGFEKAVEKTHDLFSLFEQGKLTIQQVGGVFEQVFTQLIPNAISKTSKLASASFVELQQTALREGLQSPALEQFRSQQIGSVNTGLTSTLGVNADATAKALDLQKQLNDAQTKGNSDENKAVGQIVDLQKRLDKETDHDKRIQIQQQINDLLNRGANDYQNVIDLQKQLDAQQKIIAATSIKSQAAATGFAGALLATFSELQRQGVPIIDIFKQIGPNIAALQDQLDKTGFSGGAAFDTIRQLSALASDELAGPALDAVSGVQQALAGLANTGGLDADTFSGLAASVGDTFRSLVEQGKDGNQILKLMAPTLQTIFELQERTGFAVDETTANLIAQAKAQGLVGDQFKSTGAQTVDALNKTNEILTAIAVKLGATLPAAAEKAADGINDALGSIKAPDLKVNIDFIPRGIPSDIAPSDIVTNDFIPTASTGGWVTASGIQHFASGGRVLPFLRRGTDTVPAMLTPGEVVLNASQQARLSQALSSDSVVNVHAHLQIDGRQVTTVVLQDVLRDKRGAKTILKRAIA